MADETEADGAVPRIENEQQFAQWLEETRPAPDVCVALAARAALRALPFIIYLTIFNKLSFGKTIERAAGRMFRATAVSWVTAKYPGRIRRFQFNINAAKNSVVAEAANSDPTTSNLIWAAVNAAKSARSIYSILSTHEALDNSIELDARHWNTNQWLGSEIYKETYDSVEAASNGIVLVVERQARKEAISAGLSSFSYAQNIIPASISHSLSSAKKAIWGTVALDAHLVLTGLSALQLADTTLWHGSPSAFVSSSWSKLAEVLPDIDDWWVWKNWYEDRLKGISHGEAHDLIYATVPVEEWDKGPAAANKWIAERLAELEKDPPDHIIESFKKLIAQDPHGAAFEFVEGKARIAASLDENDARVAENPQTIQLHERVKIRANSARERVRRLANQPGFESIAATVEEFYSYISGDTLSVAANISTVWELSVAIGSFIERDDEIRAGRGGMVSEMDADARETLDQLINASAPFVRRFPTARQNDDDVRLFKQSREILDPAKQIFEQAIKENLIEETSKAVIAAALNAAEISSGIQSEKSRSWIANTARNLARSLFNFVVASGVGFGAFFVAAFTGKAIEDFYDHSQSGPLIREFLLEKEDDIIHLFSDLPSDVRATIRETYHRLKKL